MTEILGSGRTNNPSVRALLVDLSGTIHVENEVIPGAVEAVKKLRDAKMPIKFVTNTTKVGELHGRTNVWETRLAIQE